MGLFNFSKRSSYLPSEDFLRHQLSDKFFYRTMSYFLTNGKVTAIDNNAPRVITFDFWLEVIFLSANGKITFTQLLIEIADKYKGNVPPLLENTIIKFAEKLIDQGYIAISDKPVELENNLLHPIKK